MKNVIFSAFIFFASITSVSVLSGSNDQAAHSKSANMVIYRPNDGSAINYHIAVDDKYMGRLKRNAVISLQLKPGDHIISLNDAKHTKLEVTADTQKITYIRININRKSRLSLTITEPTEQLATRLSATNRVIHIN